MTRTTADGRKEALADFRAKYFHELGNSLNVAIAIRDNPDASDKDRNEANKFIARLLDALAPERQTSQAQKIKESLKKSTKPELSLDLKGKLANLYAAPRN